MNPITGGCSWIHKKRDWMVSDCITAIAGRQFLWPTYDKRTYENIHHMPQSMKHVEHQWELSGGDLKVVALVVWLQSEYTKYCRFLWVWMGQPCNRFPLHQERLVTTSPVTGAWNKTCSPPTSRWTQQNAAITATHKTWAHEEFCHRTNVWTNPVKDWSALKTERRWTKRRSLYRSADSWAP